MKRRDFIKTSFLGAAGLAYSPSYIAQGIREKEWIHLSILHTNDMHSHVDPFPINHPKYPGQGGLERRASLINKVRSVKDNVLLLDAGDIFQGTPYFNFYKGEVEYKAMNLMGYDATTIGNHDFDNGIEGLNNMLPQAQFKCINANYNLSDTIISDKVIPHYIFERSGLKIGVFGVGVALEGLVLPSLYGNTQYLNPLSVANKQATFLKEEKKCDLVVCLSHLGYKYKTRQISDVILAQQSKDIDIIIGGHTHTFLEKPTEIKNSINKKVLINQVGWAGLQLGRIEIGIKKEFNQKNANKKILFFHKKNILV